MSLLQRAVVRSIGFYRVAVSPFLGSNCRFHPTCSVFAIEAVELYGVPRGLWMAGRRLLRCHPYHPGGYDPVRPVAPES
jgi:hypothetical protein